MYMEKSPRGPSKITEGYYSTPLGKWPPYGLEHPSPAVLQVKRYQKPFKIKKGFMELLLNIIGQATLPSDPLANCLALLQHC